MPHSRLPADTYARIDELVRVGNLAVAKAQHESRQLGVPNVYSVNGHRVYETPNGELATIDPFADGRRATVPVRI